MTALVTRPEASTTKSRLASQGTRSGSSAASGGAAWAVAAVIALAVWETVSYFSGQWVPSVAEVAGSVGDVLSDGGTAKEAGVTLRRVAFVTVASISIGVAVGLAAGFSWVFRALTRPILVMGLAIPDLVYLIMAILILGATESSGVIAMTVAIIPLVTNAVSNSVLNRDHGLDEMAKVYRFTSADYARHVVLEQLKPALAAAVRTGFAFSWKLIVLMEALTMPDGIGARIYGGFRYLRPEDMLAYAVIFIVLMKVIERVLLLPFKAQPR